MPLSCEKKPILSWVSECVQHNLSNAAKNYICLILILRPWWSERSRKRYPIVLARSWYNANCWTVIKSTVLICRVVWPGSPLNRGAQKRQSLWKNRRRKMCSKWNVLYAATNHRANTMEYSPVKDVNLSLNGVFAVTSATLAELHEIALLISITEISVSIAGLENASKSEWDARVRVRNYHLTNYKSVWLTLTTDK